MYLSIMEVIAREHKRNLHKKIQEKTECFSTSDPLKEKSFIQNEKDHDEAALEWIATVVLHGINNNAKK